VDVSKTLAAKLRILGLFKGELARFPFPRSRKAVSALAAARGAASGFRAAEAFMLLRELV
jgi:N-acetylglucosamine malate deacetylase 1